LVEEGERKLRMGAVEPERELAQFYRHRVQVQHVNAVGDDVSPCFPDSSSARLLAFLRFRIASRELVERLESETRPSRRRIHHLDPEKCFSRSSLAVLLWSRSSITDQGRLDQLGDQFGGV